MPLPCITITAEPSGSVTAKGADDDVSATLLTHAGFQQIEDWYGRRHRIPTTTPAAERSAIAIHAAEMLHAARYDVDLDHRLDATGMATPARPLGPYTAGAELLRITDQIRSAENGEDLRRAVDHLLHPEHGALERAREALEATGEQINDLDDSVYRVADQFGAAAELVSAAQSELVGCDVALGRISSSQQPRFETRARSARLPDSRSAALSSSPAAAKAKVSPTPDAEGAAPAVRPSQAPGARGHGEPDRQLPSRTGAASMTSRRAPRAPPPSLTCAHPRTHHARPAYQRALGHHRGRRAPLPPPRFPRHRLRLRLPDLVHREHRQLPLRNRTLGGLQGR